MLLVWKPFQFSGWFSISSSFFNFSTLSVFTDLTFLVSLRRGKACFCATCFVFYRRPVLKYGTVQIKNLQLVTEQLVFFFILLSNCSILRKGIKIVVAQQHFWFCQKLPTKRASLTQLPHLEVSPLNPGSLYLTHLSPPPLQDKNRKLNSAVCFGRF